MSELYSLINKQINKQMQLEFNVYFVRKYVLYILRKLRLRTIIIISQFLFFIFLLFSCLTAGEKRALLISQFLPPFLFFYFFFTILVISFNFKYQDFKYIITNYQLNKQINKQINKQFPWCCWTCSPIFRKYNQILQKNIQKKFNLELQFQLQLVSAKSFLNYTILILFSFFLIGKQQLINQLNIQVNNQLIINLNLTNFSVNNQRELKKKIYILFFEIYWVIKKQFNFGFYFVTLLIKKNQILI
eukprot:TRINITY_DN6381_c1_g1_i1.p2 TRINITY_DN6381_c1_g1~~TRINITY_DN6381_c1_g1_i1.p2  ORF type:complete len:263 (-),score=-9.73 TRINITY_DN6381_c1_g1_i1:339-1073(-)